MIVRVIPAGGFGAASPLVIAASEVIITHPDGTVIGVARVEGPTGCARLCHPGDADFPAVCRAAGLAPPQIRTIAGSAPGGVVLG